MEPTNIYFSPNKMFKIEIYTNTMAQSHEVNSPYLIDCQTDNIIFSIGTLWDVLSVDWNEDSKNVLTKIRHYSNGGKSFDLLIDLIDGSAVLMHNSKKTFSGTLEHVSKKMENIFDIDAF